MSNIKELANVPEISFIENMSLQETEELVRANYTRIFKELTGQDAELGEADAKNLIIKSFSLVLYQVMQYVEAKGLTFVPISAATMQGVKELPGLVYNRLKDIPPVPVFAPEYKKPEPKANDRAFEIKRMEAHVWSVEAPWLEYILAGSNVDDYESLQFFQRQLGESGILDALVQKGVQENDTILIGEYQFDYIF